VNEKINPKTIAGAKKLSMQLIPPSALTYMAAVFEHGAAKYGPFNWRESDVPIMTYIGAIHRHVAALLDGEDTDPESGLPHAAHIMTSCAIVIDSANAGTLVDDRPPPGGASFDLAYHAHHGVLPKLPSPHKDETQGEQDTGTAPPALTPTPSNHVSPDSGGFSRSVPGGLSAAEYPTGWPYETFRRP